MVELGGAWWIDEGGKKHGIGIQITRDVVESDLESVV